MSERRINKHELLKKWNEFNVISYMNSETKIDKNKMMEKSDEVKL